MAVTLDHFKRAALDVGANGDNDTLPFDMDVRFVKECQDDLASLAFDFCSRMSAISQDEAHKAINALDVFHERLLVPTGAAGFRVTTKIHPFWNVYLNGLAVAIAEAHEPLRSDRAHSYRYTSEGDRLFDRVRSWRGFREATLGDCADAGDDAVVVQTDISSFYEHVYHHRIENFLGDLLPAASTLPTQIDRFLSKLASGRSFGLPVGGQCSRVLAEVLLAAVDRTLSELGIVWRRYVDDFVLVCPSQAAAYEALAHLSHSLADFGLTLNRTKTTFLSTKHYQDYVTAQLGTDSTEASKLREIDLYFDPYSDRADEDYEELKETVESLEVRTLLDLELNKSQPDTFMVAQIGRTLKLHSPEVALQLCGTLLAPRNLHAFRASWATIMRGIAAVRSDPEFYEIFAGIDHKLDAIPDHSPHLLKAEASILHYARTLRFGRTEKRAAYVRHLHATTNSVTVRRACLDCWGNWADRINFVRARNTWGAITAEEQRTLWVASRALGDDGSNFRAQERRSSSESWSLGIEVSNRPTFAGIYERWGSR